MDAVHYSSKSGEWETPKSLFKALDQEFDFKLDAAATNVNSLCESYYTLETDALQQDWSKYGSIWCNPPYGRQISKFVKKAYDEAKKGCTVVLLVPARTDTTWFHQYCSLGEVRFIKGRLKFVNRTFPSYREDGNFKISPANFPSCIVVFRQTNYSKTLYINK